MARGTRRTFTARPPRRLNWSALVGTTANSTVAAATKVIIGAFTLDNPGISETVMRTRGRIYISSDQSAAEESQIGALGMAVVTDNAHAAGAASLPGPVTDAGDDGWFLWMPIIQSGAADITAAQVGLGYDFDSKAMRRVEQGYRVVVMIENASASNAFEFGFIARLLAKRM